ncbi:hypothetical protein ACL02S_23445 [Nocardia sp. 004]|uniref:hypothetical protein n=1 Tax=Nocardia sp. 004 TaxID=3385978 RepID=UPI0039A1B861
MSHLHEALVKRVHLVDIPATRWHACKSVLRCIAEHANEASADTAWPGVELMMLETGMSESVIVRTTGLLAEHGWITKTRRFGTSNLYRLNVGKLRAHQVTKPAVKAVHMSEHLPALLFPGEELGELVAEVAAAAGPLRPVSWSLVAGRSTAAARAAARRSVTDPARPLVDITEKPQVTTNYVDSTYSPYPNPVPHPKTSIRRDRSRRSDVTENVDSTIEPVVKNQGTNRQRPQRHRETAGGANACLSESSTTTTTTTTARAGAVSSRARTLLRELPLGWEVVMPSVIAECGPDIDARLNGGWLGEVLTRRIRDRFAAAVTGLGGVDAVRNPPGLLIRVVRELPMTPPPASSPSVSAPRRPWCGQCDGDDHRWIEHLIDAGTPTEHTASSRCPRCHPGAAPTDQLIDA